MSENKVLSREDILAMEPGRELDSVVMKTIFNASKNYYGEEELWFHYDSNGEPDYEWSCYFSPSTDISAAWEVVEKMQGLRELHSKKVRLMVKVVVIRGAYTVSIIDYLDGDKCLGEEIASTAPEAICKAALLAVME